jgi:hypothetical protein
LPSTQFTKRLLLVDDTPDSREFGRQHAVNVGVVGLAVDQFDSFANHPSGQAPDSKRRNPFGWKNRYQLQRYPRPARLFAENIQRTETHEPRLHLRRKMAVDPQREILRASDGHGYEKKRGFQYFRELGLATRFSNRRLRPTHSA